MTVPRTREMLITARSFEAAADMLFDVAPDEIVQELRSEARYLNGGDLTDLGTAEGVQGRYCDASRASRRMTVNRWIGDRQPSAVQQQALNMIGGC